MNRKTVAILVILILLAPGLLFAQRTTGGRRSSSFQLSVQCNVSGARVVVENAATKGSESGSAPAAFTLAQGTYQVTVSAQDYVTQTQSVNLTANQSLNFNLQPLTYALRITSNVPGAQVQIQGPTNTSGRTTYSGQVRRGGYRITVSANGYNTATRNVNIASNQNIHIDLTPAMGTVNFYMPTDYLDLRNGNPMGLVEVYVDGQRQSSNRTISVRPGRHTFRISSGAFNIQKVLDIQAGEVYDFELFMDLRLSVGK